MSVTRSTLKAQLHPVVRRAALLAKRIDQQFFIFFG